MVAKLAEAQLVADGIYPNAAAVFAEDGVDGAGQTTADAFPFHPGFHPAQPRDPDGRWAAGGDDPARTRAIPINAEERRREHEKELEATGEVPPAVEAEPVPEMNPTFGMAPRVPGLPFGAKPSLPAATFRPRPAASPGEPDPGALRPELPPVDPRAAQKLDNVLSEYDTRRYTIDDQTFQLDKAGMRHILERHAPEY